MKILVVGTGAREHALVRRLSKDSSSHDLHAAPGNPGMTEHATLHDVALGDGPALTRLACDLGIELVVIGPEAPLVAGLADEMRAAGLTVFGPSKAAAKLEGSKDFAKRVMNDAGIPTARSITVTDPAALETAMDQLNTGGKVPYVVKADGLAAGKGVVVTASRDEALEHARACLTSTADDARVVLEEFLDGPELSVFCVSDGERVLPLVPAQDFKRAFKGDEGPNTGGMGAYSPLPWLDEAAAMRASVEKIAEPLVRAMRERDTPFIGLLFCGLAATRDGLKVIEFNVRFGDPETLVVLERLESDLGALLHAAATGNLTKVATPTWHEESAVAVVLASEGYPLAAHTGREITGLDSVEQEDCAVIHAGTKRDADGTLLSSGGRVLSVVAREDTLENARVRAQSAIAHVLLDGSHYRTDIAERAAHGEIERTVRL
ncbi:phosphoribosylamine-glycine ligase [Dermabacter vaginalis]|uniref:Phosphoribosylamine--glycine ligase n=1 Tax=Dermabacter vaginalis TaxID=1630135 RepID=A0A1B0ZGT9_9MICO|nr:phosphoribosylamine--glycine ligase [Dermabacter vaginalis]ANP27133.1 phosphoribosylamine-glycine ligase [Dermabacter vaginalis]